MPSTPSHAINFLETQWSSINDNKIKGILAEIRFKDFLFQNNYHYAPGGWIVTPGKPTINKIPTKEKICILPRKHMFTWQNQAVSNNNLTPAEITAYSYFRQVGMKAIFATPATVNELSFANPAPRVGSARAKYPRPYMLDLHEIGPNGTFSPVSPLSVFNQFPKRNGNAGLRCHNTGRIIAMQAPWTDTQVLSDLFWFEYSRYYFQIDYLLSSNDLDLFIIGPSGRAYPAELKSKAAAVDSSLGSWFGIDMGPYAKLSFFTANAMNTDALYVVEEVDSSRNHVEWYGIRFTDLVKCCSWVGQAGGTGMMGGVSSTFKIPKSAFTPLLTLMPTL